MLLSNLSGMCRMARLHCLKAILAGLLATSAPVWPGSAVAGGPSYDCSRAASADEKAICSDDTLSQIDAIMTEAYRAFTAEFQDKKKIARLLLKDRAACGDDKVCILTAQYSALETFKGAEPWIRNLVMSALGKRAAEIARSGDDAASAIPTIAGECVRTRIKAMTTRFGDPVTYDNEDQGTALQYDNGNSLITYDRDAAFYNEKVGSPVVVCLMSIPYDCPDGDDRGKIYYSFDPETKAEWSLPDSQHMCGGA